MSKTTAYIKKTFWTGLAVLIPILVVGLVLFNGLKKLVTITKPLTDRLSLGGPVVESIIAITMVVVLLAIFFFLGGALYNTYVGNQVEKWIENKLLVHIPFFKTLKGLTNQLTGAKKAEYPVVEVDLNGNKNSVVGLMTDTLKDGRRVIFIPFAPMLTVGQLHIVANENVKALEMSIKDATDLISKIGFDASKEYK